MERNIDMSIKDVIKDSVLESLYRGDLFVSDIIMALMFASVFGIYLYFLYQFTAKNELNNRDFQRTLALLPLITAGILLAMQSNLVVSLGMVGALSIVRYRTAVKNPMDLAFLFLSISVGIIVGTGIYKLAILTVAFFTVMLFVINCLPAMHAPCLLVVCAEKELQEALAEQIIRKRCRRVKLRNRMLHAKGLELMWEVYASTDMQLVRELYELEHIVSVNLLEHDGTLRV